MVSRRISYAFVATGSVARNASFVRLRELGRELAKFGLDVHYFLDDEEENATRVASGLGFATVHLASGSGRASRLWQRRRQLAEVAPAAIHILNPQPGNCAAAVRQGCALVCDWDELLSSRQRRLLQRWVDLLCEHFARRYATLTVVASRALEALMKERYGVESLYLPYAAYLPSFEDGPTPFSGPTAVYLGNLMPDFDHDLLIDAWAILQRRGSPLRLCLIGGGPLLDSVSAEVKERKLTNVSVAGYLSGQVLWNYLRHAHVLLFPIRDTPGNRSRCPSKTFAYMQARRPIVANRVGEVAAALGKWGHYVDPMPEAFASALETLPQKDLPDVPYPLDEHQWSKRAETLIRRLEREGILKV
jgi:glycosyltransferase involved in cell wall biosynthesis